jgi:hypothetical protein
MRLQGHNNFQHLFLMHPHSEKNPIFLLKKIITGMNLRSKRSEKKEEKERKGTNKNKKQKTKNKKLSIITLRLQ